MDENSKMMNVSVEELISLYMAGFGNGMSTAVDAIQQVENDTHKSIRKTMLKTFAVVTIGGIMLLGTINYLKQKEKAEEKKEDTYIYGEES